MKIVDICEFYSPQGGGVRTYVHAKLAAVARYGCELLVVAPGERDEEVRVGPGARLRFVRAPRLPVDPRYFTFWEAEPVHRILDREQPDVLEASSPWRGAWIASTWRGRATRSIFMHHDPLSVWAYSWLDGIAPRPSIDRGFAWLWDYLRRTCAGYEIVVCGAPSLARRLTAGGVAGAVTCPLGVEAGAFSPGFRDAAVRRELLARCGLPESAPLLVSVGRHTPEKRWPCVLDAVARVGAGRPVGHVLIGDGHGRAGVLKRIAGNPHVLPLAPIRNRRLLATVLASADCLVHGSAAETFGLVVAEAMASGLALVVPADGAVADLADPAAAEFYRPGNRLSAAEAVERLLDRDPLQLRAATLAVAARVRTMEEHFHELFGLYASAGAGRRAA